MKEINPSDSLGMEQARCLELARATTNEILKRQRRIAQEYQRARYNVD